MALVSITEAAKLVRRNRSTLYRDIERGRLSKTVTPDGETQIETSELLRTYGRLHPEEEDGKQAQLRIALLEERNRSLERALALEAELRKVKDQVTNELRLRLADKDNVIKVLESKVLFLEYDRQVSSTPSDDKKPEKAPERSAADEKPDMPRRPRAEAHPQSDVRPHTEAKPHSESSPHLAHKPDSQTRLHAEAKPITEPRAASEVNPVEPKPAEAKSAEVKPAEPKPVDARPVEIKPVAEPFKTHFAEVPPRKIISPPPPRKGWWARLFGRR